MPHDERSATVGKPVHDLREAAFWPRSRRPHTCPTAIGSPTNEAAVLGLAGKLIPPLGKGQGVLLIEDGGHYRVEPLA